MESSEMVTDSGTPLEARLPLTVEDKIDSGVPNGAATETPKYDEKTQEDEYSANMPKKGEAKDAVQLKKFRSEVKIILHTVNDNEFQAAITFMEPPMETLDRPVKYHHKSGMVVYLGIFAEKKTVLIQKSCQVEMKKVLKAYPIAQYVLAVGVCFGNRKKVKLGDVLVSQKIDFFDSGKSLKQFLFNNFCERLIHDPSFVVTTDKRNSEVHSGLVVSPPFFHEHDSELALTSEAIGGEMEGGAILQLLIKEKYTEKGVIVIKGVADFVHGDRGKVWQYTAAKAALHYTWSKLKNVEIPDQADPKFPGIIFCTDSIQQSITSQGIQCTAPGISVTIPEQALSPTELEKEVDIVIRPCFKGPFEFPAGYEAASPIYLVETSREVEIQRDITLQIHHYASLQSEEDCAEMMFISASSSPQHKQTSPSYVFKAVKESEGSFSRRSHVGKIVMPHLCLIGIVRSVIGMISGNNHSARLYRRDSEQASTSNSVVLCMCLFQPLFIKHCDDNITKEFPALQGKNDHLVRLEGNKATLSVRNSEGWKITVDQKPLKRDLEVTIQFNVLNDNPQKFIIDAEQTSPHADSECPQLVVKGLDDECAFGIVIGRSFSDFGVKPLSNDGGSKSTVSLLRLEKVHQEGITGKNIRLAIIEPKFNANHAAFKGCNIISPTCDPNDLHIFLNHGTSVVGIAIGKEVGVAPDAVTRVFPLLSIDFYQSLLHQLKEISGAVPKYDIVSISHGGLPPPDVVDVAMRDIIGVLNGKGTIIFAASGNDGDQERVKYPACLDGVISVGSLTPYAKRAEQAKTKDVDVYCYGDNVVAPYGNGADLMIVSGSSMATPAVAGLACLALQCAKKHGYKKLCYRKEMLSMLNKAMRVRGEDFAFDAEGFLLNAFKSASAFEKL